MYFADYDAMPGKISIPDLIRSRDAGTLTRGEHALLSLLTMAGLKLEEFQQVGQHERLIRALEIAGNEISESPIMQIRVLNRRHRVSVAFDERWSPLQGCQDPATAIRRADAFAFAVPQKGVEDGTFWSAKASDYLRGYFHAAALAGYDVKALDFRRVESRQAVSEAKTGLPERHVVA